MRLFAFLLCVVFCVLTPQARAVGVNSEDGDCYDLKLQHATGVPANNVHQYSFKGFCKRYTTHRSDGKVTGRSNLVSMWSEANASWDAKTNTLEETVKIQDKLGPHSGVISSQFKCDKDPLIYSSQCALVTHENKTGWTPFSNAALNQKRPILKGKTSLKEAEALSQKYAASAPTSPSSSENSGNQQAAAAAKIFKAKNRSTEVVNSPITRESSSATATKILNENHSTVDGAPPAVTKENQPASAIKLSRPFGQINLPNMFVVEGEQLVRENRVSVNAGAVAARSMSGIGAGWSGNEQLFWHGGKTGAVIDLTVDAPAAGYYAVEVYFTRSPDAANLSAEINGQSSPLNINGYSPDFVPPTPMQAGKFQLNQNTNSVSFMITGRYMGASDYVVGLDKIVFYPAGEP